MDTEKLIRSASSIIDLLNVDTVSVKLLSESMVSYVDNCIDLVKNIPEDEGFFQRRMEFQWSHSAKEVALLLRDILFRIYRDAQYSFDDILDPAVNTQRNKESKEVFEDAHSHLQESYSKLKIASEKNIPEHQSWKHYNSPVQIFYDQMTALIDQIKMINEAQIHLNEDRQYVEQIRNSQELNQEKIYADIDALRSSLQVVKSAILKIENFEDNTNINSAKSILKKSLEKIEEIKNSYAFEKNSGQNFKSIAIPIGVNKGELLIKEISILSQISSWIENFIYPSIYEAQRSLVLTCDNFLIALINVQNRLELSTSEKTEITQVLKSSIVEPIDTIEVDPNVLDDEIHDSIHFVNNKFKENIAVSNVFDKENFLFNDQAITGISQIKVTTPKWLSSLPVKRLGEFYNRTYKQFISPSITSESSISAIDFIDKKTIKSLDQYNHSLFLNKGYLGKTFIVDRPGITVPIINNYKSWLDGFRGSFLVYGSRLSGKTTILKSVFSEVDDTSVIQLKPDKLITFQGRKHETKYDLGASLSFIDKYVYNKKVILIIDDIELWRDKNISLYENIKNLLDFMGRSYKRVFFLISTNQWAKEQLDLYFDFSNQFVSTSSCNRMRQKEIQKALLIRHGATISELIYQDDKQPDKLYLQKQTLRIASASRDNIGQSLLNWCRFSFQNFAIEEDVLDMPEKLVTIIKENREIFLFLLRAIYTNEIELTTAIGSRFVKQVAADIQKLVSYKLLLRNTDGNIEINDYIVSDIEAIMKYTTNKISVYA